MLDAETAVALVKPVAEEEPELAQPIPGTAEPEVIVKGKEQTDQAQEDSR